MEPLNVVAYDELPGASQDALRTAYEEAFPPELRVQFDDLLVDHVLGFLDGDQPVGVAVVRELPKAEFLRYFAAVRRGGGAGAAMLAALEDWSRNRGAHLLALDVEDPDEAIDDAEETMIRRRRVAFYERCGIQVLPIVGYAPDHGPSMHGHAPEMQLLAADLDVAPDARQPFPADRLREVLVLVLTGRYGYSPDHPDVRRMLADSGLLP